MNINDYQDFENITIAEYKEAISKTEEVFLTKIKNKDIIGALEATKLKLKLENLLNKKITHGSKNGYENHKRT